MTTSKYVVNEINSNAETLFSDLFLSSITPSKFGRFSSESSCTSFTNAFAIFEAVTMTNIEMKRHGLAK